MKKFLTMFMLSIFMLSLVSCKKLKNCKKDKNDECIQHFDENQDGKCDKCNADVEIKIPSIKDDFNCISIAEAIEIAKNAGSNGTSEKYYIYGVIETITSYTYGEMTIKDETGSLYVYGVYSKDESTRYDMMEDKPVVGDEVVLYGILKTYKDKPELDRGYLQAMKHVEKEIDDSAYQEMTIDNVRKASKGDKVKVTGVVAKITYAFGMVPNGFYLVDKTGSIYVYGNAAGSVKEGNTVTLIGEKTYYVSEKEQSAANKHGYEGCCQIQKPEIVSNDKKITEFDKSWIKESTVKEIMDTPVTNNITTNIYKVKAIIKKVEGTGFTNYYINDLDNYTGSYTYTMCSGSDFTWLDQYDGKVCTVYLSPINAKSESSGCFYRFIPVQVVEEEFEYDQSKSADFVIDYYVVDKFLNKYTADPAVEFNKTISYDLINVVNANISFTSENENIAYFEETEDLVIFHTKDYGTTNITVTVTHGAVVATRTIEITVEEAIEYDTITVEEAVESADGTEVYVKGIVVSSLVNQDGFYLSDETGIIAVVGNSDQVAELSCGDEVIIKGIKSHKKKDSYAGAGQINIYNAEVLVNNYGNHEYSTKYFDSTKTLEDLYALNHTEEHSNEVYIVNAIVVVEETNYYTKIMLKSPNSDTTFSLYCSSANQYSFLKQYAGQEVTLELAICNWNSKNYYTGCVISATYNGVKTMNTLYFNE